MRLSKKLDKLLDQEIKSQIPGLDEEKLFENLGITHKKTKSNNPFFTWGIRIGYTFAIIILSVILSITIYSKIESDQYDKTNIVEVASNLFRDEMRQLGEYEQIIFVNPQENLVFAIYKIKYNNEYKMIYYNTDKITKNLYLNEQKINIDTELSIESITLEEVNEIKLIIDEEVVFSTFF